MKKKSYKKVGQNIVRTLYVDDIKDNVNKAFEVASLQSEIAKIDSKILSLQTIKTDLEASLAELQAIQG